MLEPRAHIQTHGEANTTEIHYWAYPSRVLPCTSGQGTCEYLDAVYWMHTTSMLYTFIMWAVFGGILVFCFWLRYAKTISQRSHIQTPLRRGLGALRALGRRWLLPESAGRWLFGRVTMLQVAILLTLSAYLLIFSLVGIVYKTWVTPVKKHPGVYNTRVGMGGFGDRVGAMAYALTPFTVALSTRESLLSLITGVPYQHFNFLHRWTGRIIFIQSFLHTLVWTIIEGNLYRPQPSVYKSFISEQYIIFGIVAQAFITFLYIFSTSWAIRWTGYEFFKRTHYVIAVLYLGACWGHWDGLACWMIASIILLGLDKGARLLRTGLLHIGYLKGTSGLGFQCAHAKLQHFGDRDENGDGEVLRIDFDFAQAAWQPGQHFYLCFPAISLWQSHPFTPSSLPDGKKGLQHHTYLIRVRKGITAKVAELARSGSDDVGSDSATTPVIICGPYGGSKTDTTASNLLTIAGGTGVTSVLPVMQDALSAAHVVSRAMDFVWIIRYARDLEWISPELLELREAMKYGRAEGLRIKIFVTRELAPTSVSNINSSSNSSSSDIARPRFSSIDEKQQLGARSSVKKTCCGSSNANADVKELPISASTTSPSITAALLEASTPNFEVNYLNHSHPRLDDVVDDFSSRAQIAGGASHVVGAGPDRIGTALRSAVAKKNHCGKVWEGDESAAMGLEWDCRS
ncbi:hypothetical protein AAFC00_005192 [Neodothiora populina]|uniref:ferric-chelate reductase (NADPH) n=1 Tax=Neodothiora populina TaxID=2781224 RepID=A0ABR3PK34_9PEZI